MPAAQALRQLGHSVEEFFWSEYFHTPSPIGRQALRLQNKLLTGPAMERLNRDLVSVAARFAPDLVFLYRGTHIRAATIRRIKAIRPACRVFAYCNDDPFSPKQPRRLWRHFLQSIPLCDAVFAYRPRNIQEFVAAGAQRVELLMPWFIPSAVQEPASPTREEPRTDVVFVGHYEPDHRIAYLQALVDAGIDVRLFGPDWERAPALPWLSRFQPIAALRDDKYYRVLRSARIALCFFSALNRDTYTRRCFEIPAVGTLLLSEYSEDAASLFREGSEADFFRTPDELVAKVRMYLSSPELCAEVAAAGRRRVYADGHDVLSRMRMVTRVAEMA